MWQTLEKKSNRTYDGLSVGYGTINLSASVHEQISKWGNVAISFSSDENAIRLSKSDPETGFRITKHRTLHSNIHRHMPLGRYGLVEGQEEFTFKKLHPTGK